MKRIIPSTLLLFGLSLFLLPLQGSAQCGAGQTTNTYCYGDGLVNEVAFEFCPTAGQAAQSTITAGTFGIPPNTLTVYSGTSGSGTAGTVVFGPATGDVSGNVIEGLGADQCLIFVVNSIAQVAINCEDGFDTALEVCSESIAAAAVSLMISPDEFCDTDGTQTLGGGLPTGGSYMGTGVTDDGNGTSFTFNPAGLSGPITVTYTNGGSATDDITVFASGGVSFTALNDLCIDAGIQTGQGGATPTGGTYSGPGVTDDGNGMTYSFNPAVAGLGVHNITYTEQDGCMETVTDQVEVLAACGCPQGQTNHFYCYGNLENNTVAFEVCPTAGMAAQASITAGILDAPNDNLSVYQGASGSGTSGTLLFGPANANLAGNVISGNIADNCLIFVINSDVAGSCQDGFVSTGLAVCGESIAANVSFQDPGDFCSNDGVQTNLGGGTPTGGTYMGPGVTDDGNGTSFTFNPANAGVGTHILTYTNGNAATVEIEVFQNGATTFTALDDVCLDAGVQSNISGGNPAGGTFSGPGVTDNGNGTYNFNPAFAGLGIHTISYTAPTACAETVTDQVEVLAACGCPNGETSFFHCYDNNESDLVIFEVCPSAGEFAEATIVSGSYGAGDELSVYEGASGSGTSGTAFGMFTGDFSSAGYTFTASTPDNCIIFVSNSNFILSCQDGLETPLSVCGRSLDNLVTFTALDDLSINAGVQTGLSGGFPVGGEYGGPGVMDGMDGLTYSFDPLAAGLGTHILTYTVNGETATDEVTVFNITPPTFSKSFSPNNVGVGAVSVLTFTINNTGNSQPATDLDFTDNLPAGMTVASVPNANTNCTGGTLTANAGATSISYSEGAVGGSSSCTISVHVVSTTTGTNTNTTGDLTSSAGNSGTATNNLVVFDGSDRPLFSKSFNPSTINVGERSTLTFTIDNTLNSRNAFSLNLRDNLPTGLVVASPSNISTTCTGGLITAVPGTDLVTYAPQFPGDASVASGASCQVTVDVEASISGELLNITEELTGVILTSFNSGIAVAPIEVLPQPEIFIDKSFSPNPVRPGETTTLEFTLTNLSRDFDATNVAFTDDLNAVLSGLVATGTPVSACGGTLTGTSNLSFSGGSVATEGACTISVQVQVPAGAALGSYTNTTSAVTADFNGNTVTGNAATEDLFVENVPIITKTFLTNPVVAGGTTTLEFTITNTSSTADLTNIDFQDDIGGFISGATVTSSPSSGSCGAGSFFFTAQNQGSLNIFVSDANIPASGSCTFSFDITIPSQTVSGTYTNTTELVSGNVDGASTQFGPATADLQVLAAPRLSKTFIDDPVNPGETVDLEFTLTYDEFATVNATNITFTDNLNSTLAGLVATNTPISACGGTITGTSDLSFSGGTLTPGETCTFTVTLQVPADALPNTYTNTTSAVTAMIAGQTATGAAATDNLTVGGLSFTKEFIDDPALPLDFISLRFTLENEIGQDANIIFFTDNLAATLSGLSVVGTSMNTCGGTVGGNSTFIQYTGGTIPANSSCIVEIDLLVPQNAQDGIYPNITSDLVTTIGTAPAASDVLEIDTDRLSITKSFTDDPAQPGGTVTLEYTITNLDQSRTVSSIEFTDNFDGLLTGLAATGLPTPECGGSLSGTGFLNFSGGSLAPGASCTFSVTLNVPANAPPGAVYTSTTSDVSYVISGNAPVPLTADPASDDLFIQGLTFTKSIAEPVEEGGTTIITFSLTNNTSLSLSGIDFTDDLDAFIPGATVVNLPASTATCGATSGVSGTSIIDFGRGELGPGESCSFDVEIMIPCGTQAGSYTNTTSEVSYQIGQLSTMSSAATTTVMVQAAPATGSFTALDDLCVNDGVQSGLSGGTPAGGTYSGPGVTDNNGTYSFNPMNANLGSNTITYTVLDDNGCSLVQYTDEVVVFGLPTVAFTAPADLCENDPPLIDLGGGTPTGGMYFGPGVNDNMDGLMYDFDPSTAGVGTHILMYTFTNGNGCTNTASDDIEVFSTPSAPVAVQQTVTYCAPEDNAADRQLSILEPAGVDETVVWVLTDAPTGSAFDGSEPQEFSDGEMNAEFSITDGNKGEILTMLGDANGTISGTWSFDVKVVNSSTSCGSSEATGYSATAYPAPEFSCLTTTPLIVGSPTITLTEADVVIINNFGNPPECSLTVTDISPNTFDCDDIGQTFSITVTVEDGQNNVSNCTATVTIGVNDLLPEGWEDNIIGDDGIGSDLSFDPCAGGDGEFTIASGGNNATSTTTDNIAFANQTLCGDATITAKIESVTPNGYGGLMIRETIDPGSKQVSIFSNMSNILRHEARYATNSPKQVQQFVKPGPFWLRLQRQGDWVFAYYSTTGAPNTFQYVHAVFVSMNDCVEYGLASFTFLTGQQTSAVFSNVSLDGGSMDGLEAPELSTTMANQRVPSLYPNPTNSNLNLVFEDGLATTTIVSLRNQLGQVIEQRELRPSDFNTEWNVSTLADGLYFFEIRQQGEAIQVLRLVKTQ